MADGGGSGDIIIKGGSVKISFDDSLYLKETPDPSSHKHQTRKITRVQVDDEEGKSRYDSGSDDSGLIWTIKVSTSE
jgi:hypothetical protein